MKNVPRIFIDEKLEVGKKIELPRDTLHYLTKVMRTDECLVFNNGTEYVAKLVNCSLFIVNSTEHIDPSNNITLAFAPIKKTDDLVNMATQMGVARLQPVITERTVAHHINWARMKKIIIEAAEQSNRNSVPELLPPQKIEDFLQGLGTGDLGLVFADERSAYNTNHESRITNHDKNNCVVFIGPEGGFSDNEFAKLDAAGAIGISLGKTILRAEVAAVAALAVIPAVHKVIAQAM